jgi:hypothetical protein
MFLIYGNEKFEADMSEADRKKMYAEYGAYSKALAEAGLMKAGAPLQPVATATTVRVRSGKTTTTDGPFAETKEQFGGYYLVECANLDEALKWAAKIPSATYGSIEVRPVMTLNAM